MSKGRVVSKRVEDHDVAWLITNSNDEIQSKQITDGYYELAELEKLSQDVGSRPCVVDVGANIGNHSVFFIKRMACRRLIAVEPFVGAYRHLLANLALNQTEALDIRLLGAALGGEAGSATIVPPTHDNIGLTRLDLGHGSVEVMRGDEVVGNVPVDLIKIDVEGMELDVLSGLSGVIERCRPAIYVETSDATRDTVIETLASRRYRVVRESTAYGSQFNLTLLAA